MMMEQRHIRRLLSSLVALVALQLQAKAQPLPRVLVCITIDQLRTDYLTELEPLMSDGGFRRMLREGKVYPAVRFPLASIDGASATTTIYTAAYPNVHGVERRLVSSPKGGRAQSALWDEQVHGIYTRDQLSARGILVNTLADRLKEASGGSALVYSVGVHAEEAIAGAGTQADGCFWLDDRVGSWATTSFFPALPHYVDRYNKSNEGVNRRLIAGDVCWRPVQAYQDRAVAYSSWSEGFSHCYRGHEAGAFKRSALANEEVATLALELIKQGGYEYRKSPSLLSLSFSAAPYAEGELSVEDVDTYVRLDRNLAQIFKTLDERIGLKHCLITVAGTGYTSYEVPKPAIGQKAIRKISLKRASALLNMYLSALYGAGDWIERWAEERLYLNRKLAESRKVALPALQEEVARFLRQVEGIGWATSAHEVLAGGTQSEEMQRLRRSLHYRNLADAYWSLTPGWYLEEVADYPALKRSATTAIPSPFILMGAGVDAKTFAYPVVEATDIARAISWVMRIRPPNAAL